MPSEDTNLSESNSSIIRSIMVEQEERSREALNPLVVVLGAVNALREREREVLSLRYGLNDGQKTTLDAVGKKFSITRERVRQIEAAAIKRLGSRPPKDLQALIKVINGHTIELGGMVSLIELMRYFKVEADPRAEAEMNAIRMVMSMNMEVAELGKGAMFEAGWIVKGFPVAILPKLTSELEAVLQAKGEPMTEDELWETMLAGKVYGEHAATINRSVLGGVLRVAARVGMTLDGKWGMKSWPVVAPKRIRDKVFLILQKTGQPMHFREIAEGINAQFAGRRVLSRTVHNELIGDGRFVLVGRGIYALKDQGFTPGVVADVIMEAIGESGGSATVDVIVEKVLARRQVKRNTVIANLQNKELFKKTGRGTYGLA